MNVNNVTNVVTVNENFTELNSTSTTYNITYVIERYVIPFVCIVGIVGNTLSFITFMQKHLRNSSCNLFLATRAVFDNVFLATLLLIWISSTFDLQLSKVLGICQILIFLTYICGCVTVWLVVFVTIENYIRICKPFMVNRMCQTRNAKIIIGILIVSVVSFYNFPFWTMNSDCTTIPYYHSVIRGMVYTDSALTLVIPTACMSILMIAISTSAVHSFNRRRRMSSFSKKLYQSPLRNVTKMLFAVTVIFVCLNLPSHVVRLSLMIKTFIKGDTEVSPLEATIQTITLLVFYSSLAINAVVYYMFGVKFRNVFKRTFMKWCSPVTVAQQHVVRREHVTTYTHNTSQIEMNDVVEAEPLRQPSLQ